MALLLTAGAGSCGVAAAWRRGGDQGGAPACSTSAAAMAPPRCSRQAPIRGGRRHPLPSSRLLPPCRVTNTSKELFLSEEAKKLNMDDEGEENYLDLPNYQVFDPDKGPLERQVQREFLDAVADDKVDVRETQYWFTSPEEGWQTKDTRLRYMDEEEPQFPQPYHSPEEEEDADERIRVEELEEGKMYIGMVTDVWLYHGVQVDIGAEFDGLIPISEDEWEKAADAIDIGEPIIVQLHKVRAPGLYRWPLQLVAADEDVQALCMDPDAYSAPIDHEWAEAQGFSMEQVAQMVGRSFEAPTYFLPQNEDEFATDIQEGYGTGKMWWRANDGAPIDDYLDAQLEDPAERAFKETRRDEIDAAFETLHF